MADARPKTDGHTETNNRAELVENIRRAFPVPEAEDFADLIRQIDESSSGLRTLTKAA